MKNYTYQNTLIAKKQLRQLLAWSFTNYDSMQACALADELKYLGFQYATQAGISITIEDLKVPFVKNVMLEKSNQEIIDAEKVYQKGKMTEVERFQKIIATWSLTSESLKAQVVSYFKTYDPLNSVYIMAFSGARGNLSQVRQLVGMRGLMSDPSGEIMNLPIKKNFREGLSITDYLMSGYGARKGIVDTALKTANAGYLTRRLIDVGQDILIREKDCSTPHAFRFGKFHKDEKTFQKIYQKLLGRVLSKAILDPTTQEVLLEKNTQITPKIIQTFQEKKIREFYIRSPFTCTLYRAICQKCYGWDLANENLVDIGEAVGILAGQSIGEPGTQLTMRTFHTGGTFTSEARQVILSPGSGILKFDPKLQTVPVRTNRGEDVLLTKNFGSLILIPKNSQQPWIPLEVAKNTIVFPKNNQYIEKDSVLGEVLNLKKEIKTEMKPILSDTSGEIWIPKLKKKVNLFHDNQLLWILQGQLYNSPQNAFTNFYYDYKVNPDSYIFRTKMINHYRGNIESIHHPTDLSETVVRVRNHPDSFCHSNVQKLMTPIHSPHGLLKLNQFDYLLKGEVQNSKVSFKVNRHRHLGVLVTSLFQTLTGGTLYYDPEIQTTSNPLHQEIGYCNEQPRFNPKNSSDGLKSFIFHRSIIWLGEESYQVKCELKDLLVEAGDFISEGFELISGLFSKTSGIIGIDQKNHLVQSISVKSGLVYEGKKLQDLSETFYYPGERILSDISVETLSFCEPMEGETNHQLLLRPIEIYEVSHLFPDPLFNYSSIEANSNLKLEGKISYLYESNQTIKGNRNLNLIAPLLNFQSPQVLNKKSQIEWVNNPRQNQVDLQIYENLACTNFILPKLRYKEIQSCFLIQSNQFIDCYTVLGYFEAVTPHLVEIVQVKVKTEDTKEIFLISNQDCVTIPKANFPHKKLNDFIVDSDTVNQTGKVILSNDHFLTLQKGRPYFFPNCKNRKIIEKTILQYKIPLSDSIPKRVSTERPISLQHWDRTKLTIKHYPRFNKFGRRRRFFKIEFSRLWLKKDGKLYRSLIPQFLKQFSISDEKKNENAERMIHPPHWYQAEAEAKDKVDDLARSEILLMDISKLRSHDRKNAKPPGSSLMLMKFLEPPFVKSAKAMGLYAVTEDYFEQEGNSMFCENAEFIEAGETLGLLNLEKEITGDIVQGLPRIEEILEARKKNVKRKRIPTSQKKGVLIPKPTLDPTFEFRKVGTSMKENEKINPNKLLKAYFNYYGCRKFFSCDRTKTMKSSRLIQNYEGSYKSFKKVQSFILHAVQSVYQSQGVSINDKHLEVVIKQMTTKVFVTVEGNAPLLLGEVVDLYHIHYMNQILEVQGKKSASYVPLLFGITKAALNNPSFLSAASFQETTRVLKKAAIEGRMDWLRGLKENIIIGNLIPAGTGSPTY